MENEEDSDAMLLAERLADHDGDELAAMLHSDWGEARSLGIIAMLEHKARRLSFLVGCCRLAADRLRRML